MKKLNVTSGSPAHKFFRFFIVYFFTSTFLASMFCYAQNISLIASIDKTVCSIDGQITLVVSASGDVRNIPNPALPDLPDFNTSSAGRSQRTSIINGKFSSSVTFNYILSPRKTGKYIIPPITLTYKGTEYKTDPLNIEITQSNNYAQTQPSTQAQESPSSTALTTPQSSDDIFITTSVDKKTAYVNEQITLSFKFYRKIRILSQPQYSPPDTTGFWSEDLPPQKNYSTIINGEQYLVTEIITALFPTAAGEYTIGSANLKCNIEDFSRDDSFGDSFFSNFFSGGKIKNLKSSPIRIKVLPLPPKPKDFNEAVGHYSISSHLDNNTIKVNQPVTLTITISGKGNIKTISSPPLDDIKNFRKYDTISSLDISKNNYTITGSKTFTTMLVPKEPGETSIPSISFSFFDPATKQYKNVKTSPIKIKVTPAPKEETVIKSYSSTFGDKEEIKIFGKDIRYNKTTINNKLQSSFIYHSPLFIMLQISYLIILIILRQYRRYTDKLNRDVSYARNKQAYKSAMHKLKEVKKQITNTNCKEFYTLLSNSALSYLGDKLNFSAKGITREELTGQLNKKHIPDEIVEEYMKILENADFACFASSSFKQEDLKNDYHKTAHIIKQLEKFLNNKKGFTK